MDKSLPASSVADVGSDAGWVAALQLGFHYAYPTVVFTYYCVTSAVAVCTLQAGSSEEGHPRRRILMWFLVFMVLSYLAQALTVLLDSLLEHGCQWDQNTMVGLLSCALVFGLQLATLWDSEHPTWSSYVGSFIIAAAIEPLIMVLSVSSLKDGREITSVHSVNISIAAGRYLVVLLFITVYFVYRGGSGSSTPVNGDDAERQPLISEAGHMDTRRIIDGENLATEGYGTTAESSAGDGTANGPGTADARDEPETQWERRESEATEQMNRRLRQQGHWLGYIKSFLAVFFPYIWPANNRVLQFRALLVVMCLLSMNLVNVLIPRQIGIIIDSLNKSNDSNPWIQVMILASLKLIASEAGLVLLRQWLWVPIEYYWFGSMSTAAYSHVLNLSSDFHDTKSSADIMMAIQAGQGVSNLLDSICFQAAPMLVDLGTAFVYLSVAFGPFEGLITLASAIVYLYIATRMLSRMGLARRGEVNAWFEEYAVRQAGIQGWATVACFNQIPHEEKRYSTAVRHRVTQSQAVHINHIIAYATQCLVLLAGLLAGAFLAVYRVTHGMATPGQFAMLLAYWTQLVAPLNFFASLSKTISKDLIHVEQLMEIMLTKPTVVSKEGALPLSLTGGGSVSFNHVQFSYDKSRDVLKDVSFWVPPGSTIAVVGATGVGKSTILKLLDRFYDVTGGSVEIDGQDVRNVDLYSLRSQIGVVPQNPILFDDTVMNNVRYGKLSASDEEVFEACRAASVHEQILGFKDGYNTRVGERGIKLSGGELQRIAIARAILKRPAIVLLDEATSAVDIDTEQKIQEALRTLCEGRTTFIVAHRLSTIINSDQIIVIANGAVSEQGSHEELIRADGKYAELWFKQGLVKFDKRRAGRAKDDVTSESSMQTVLDNSTPEATRHEHAKVGAAAAPPGDVVLCGHGDSDGGAEDPATSIRPVQRKERSSLNPEAPTFNPRSLAAALCFPNSSFARPALNLAPCVGMQLGSENINPVGVDAVVGKGGEAASSDGNEAPNPPASAAGPVSVTPTYVCPDRRLQSKSEPYSTSLRD